MKTIHYFIYISIFFLLFVEANATSVATVLHKIKSYFWKSNTEANNNATVSITIVKKRDIKESIRRSAAGGQSPTTEAIVADSNIAPVASHKSKHNAIELPTIAVKKTTICCGDMPICDEDHLMVYLAELQAINPESIINLSTVDELFLICRQVSDSLDKIDAFLATCKIADEKDLYVQLIKGVDKLFDVLCEDSSKIKQKFEEHFQCLKDLHDDFETCFGPPDWTEDNSKKEICRAYKDIADCYYIKAAKVCGTDAARAMKMIIKAVVDTILTVKCKNVLVNPKVSDSAPNSPKSYKKSYANILYTNYIYRLPIAIINTLYVM